jgi:peptidyl-prolyl cis-trans isomerase D
LNAAAGIACGIGTTLSSIRRRDTLPRRHFGWTLTAMLDGLRKLGKTWIGKIVGAFLLVGLAGFGISNVLLDFGTSTVAQVGDQEISSRDFARAYNDDLNAFARQTGQTPTPQQALAFGIPARTLSRLAADAAINDMGRRMGLGVSDERLGKMLREDPTFAGTLGQFDRSSFGETLRRAGYTEAEYFDIQTRAARRQQMFDGLFADSPAPGAAEELLTRFASDTRSVEYFVLNSQSLPPVADPTEEELAAYLTAHQADYRTRETRAADILVLTLDTLAATETVTDEEIAAEYERTKASRVRIETRTIVQAALDPAQKDTFETGLAAGRMLDELVAETGVSLTTLGTLTRAQVTDAALADAAFGLAVGEGKVIPGVGGSRVVGVTAIEPGGDIPLDEARADIDQQLRTQKARTGYTDILDQIEELRAAFQPLSQIAERFGLPLHQVKLTADGTALSAVPTIAADGRSRVATAVFAAQEDKLAPTIAFSANNNVWFDLNGIEPARDETLDEVRDAVAAAMVAERTNDAMTAEVDAVLARLKAGEAFADIAASLNQFPTLSQPLTRSGDGTPVLDQNVAAVAFAGGEGHYGAAVNGDGDHVVLQVVEIYPGAPTPELTTQMSTYVTEGTRQSLYSDFITGLRDQAGLRVNQQTLNQILALDGAGQ